MFKVFFEKIFFAMAAVLMGSVSIVILLGHWVSRKMHNIKWRKDYFYGDMCTFKDVTTRRTLGLEGRAVGKIVELTGSPNNIGVERVSPPGDIFYCSIKELKYLHPKEWLKIKSKLMVGKLANGLRERGCQC